MKTLRYKPDTFGILASTLCMLHCLATPFIFIAQSCTKTCCGESPVWWSALDFLFLAISFTAIYFSLKKSSNKLVKYALVGAWSVLLLLIVNEHIQLFELSKIFTYTFAMLLSGLHLYNLKYCQCEKKCCASLDSVN